MNSERIILDTSVIIDFIRRKDKENSILYQLLKMGHRLSISILTHTELFSGKSIWENKKLYAQTEELCTGLSILFMDTGLSQEAGKIRALHSIALVDAVIAATAIEYDCGLVTLNEKDFKKIPNLKLFDSGNIKSAKS